MMGAVPRISKPSSGRCPSNPSARQFSVRERRLAFAAAWFGCGLLIIRGADIRHGRGPTHDAGRLLDAWTLRHSVRF